MLYLPELKGRYSLSWQIRAIGTESESCVTCGDETLAYGRHKLTALHGQDGGSINSSAPRSRTNALDMQRDEYMLRVRG